MKLRMIVLFMICTSTHTSYNQERRVVNRIQLRSQEQQERDERMCKFRTDQKKKGMRGILEYVPMFAVGTAVYLDALYKFSNLDDMYWVQPMPAAEQCNFLIQCTAGLGLCAAAASCGVFGLQDLCESGICQEDNCCRECCTLCVQECCVLLGSRYNR